MGNDLIDYPEQYRKLETAIKRANLTKKVLDEFNFNKIEYKSKVLKMFLKKYSGLLI